MKNKYIPEIRFSNFKNEEWKEQKANSIFKSISDKNHPNLPVLSASQEKGMIFRGQIGIEIQYNEDSKKTYKRVRPGQFVIHLRSFQGGFAFSNVEGITSPAYTVLDFKDAQLNHSLFWSKIFTSKNFIKRLETVTYGIRDGRSISFNDFSTLKFRVPIYEEQREIGLFFKELDEAINLQQQELDTLKQTKQGFLQKMFPKEGETVPEVRFQGFSGEWKMVELNEIVTEISTGKSNFIKHEFSDTNNYPILGSTSVIGFAANYDYEGDFILTARVGANAGTLYRHTGKVKISDNTLFIKGENLSFIYPLLNYIDLKKLSFGSGQPLIKSSELKKIKLLSPASEEQNKIGEFFSQLDKTIELHEKELEALKETKKAFLQKMFV